MFQAREPQESLWQSEFLITPRKAKLMRRSWAEVFRNEALVLIEEERFAPMFSPDMGRPNRAVQTVLGVLVLKEMFDLTDMEALEELEFNLLWHHALRLEMEEAHLGTPAGSTTIVSTLRTSEGQDMKQGNLELLLPHPPSKWVWRNRRHTHSTTQTRSRKPEDGVRRIRPLRSWEEY